MTPVRPYSNWNKRYDDGEEKIEPYCRYYIISEGANTERYYFEKLIDERKELGFIESIDIRYLEKTEEDEHISYPKQLVDFAKNLKKNNKIEFNSKMDKMVIIFDYDIFEGKVEGFDKLIENKGKDIIFGITNPSFELFLLLHFPKVVDEIIIPNKKEIIENKKDGNQTPIYKYLLEKSGLNCKTNPKVGELVNSIDIAINQELLVNQNIWQCQGCVTSNIGDILSQVRKY
jgi:hypothetical protein